MTDVVSESIEVDPLEIQISDPVYIDTINVFTSWSFSAPIVGNVVYLPAIVVNNINEVPSDLPVGTAILVRAT